MRRREFIAGLAGATAWPLVALGQQQTERVHRIGFLANDPAIQNSALGLSFLQGLRENGFMDGKNILIDWRFAEGRPDLYSPLADALVRLRMYLIVTSTALATKAAKQATNAIPIVMLNVSDPVSQGIIASLAFPGGNVTGLVLDESSEIAGKRLQLIKDAIPWISRVAFVMQSDEPYAQRELQILEHAARSLQIRMQAIAVRRSEEFAEVFNRILHDRPDALLVDDSGLNFSNRSLIMDFAIGSHLPAIGTLKSYVEAGGLMSYGSRVTDDFRHAASYVAKILKGAMPADLPVEQPTKFELVINMKTAKALGLTIPETLLATADEVIQ
jgi:putative tryptophan/tyrosine transport system substrate-binding protein